MYIQILVIEAQLVKCVCEGHKYKGKFASGWRLGGKPKLV